MADIFAAIDLTTVAASVVAIGVVIIGITMAEKALGIGRRNLKKA